MRDLIDSQRSLISHRSKLRITYPRWSYENICFPFYRSRTLSKSRLNKSLKGDHFSFMFGRVKGIDEEVLRKYQMRKYDSDFVMRISKGRGERKSPVYESLRII